LNEIICCWIKSYDGVVEVGGKRDVIFVGWGVVKGVIIGV
jgi:hypothetical protein